VVLSRQQIVKQQRWRSGNKFKLGHTCYNGIRSDLARRVLTKQRFQQVRIVTFPRFRQKHLQQEASSSPIFRVMQSLAALPLSGA